MFREHSDGETEASRLRERLERYRTAVRAAEAAHEFTRGEGDGADREERAADAGTVVALEAEISRLAPTVPRERRERLLREFDDVGYLRDLLALPRREA